VVFHINMETILKLQNHNHVIIQSIKILVES